MDAASFYRAVEDQVCQGDIFQSVPHLFLKDRPKSAQPISLSGKKAGYLTDELSAPDFPQPGAEVLVPGPALIERAILLTYNCEIVKDKRRF